jgi:hypothetical protein
VVKDIAAILDGLVPPVEGGYQDVVELARERPDRLGELVRASVTSLPRASAAIDAALGLVADYELQAIADASVDALRSGADGDDSQAASLIARLALQAPDTLVHHLPDLWNLRPNDDTYYAAWPWRAATSEAAVDWLMQRFSDDPARREFVFSCLLESRTPHGLAAACALIGAGIGDDERTAAEILGAGFERRGSQLTPLFDDRTYHIVFPEDFLRLPRWVGVEGMMVDPTWRPRGSVLRSARFGGIAAATCAICHEQLHRLLALDPRGVLSAFNIEEVELVTCMSCLGWSEAVLFFDHARGTRAIGRGLATRKPEFPAVALPETNVMLVATRPRWRRQDWAMSNSRENLNRVGGEPTWIQNADYPQCPSCSETMLFVAQLDSLDFGESEWLWGSGGILYVFGCARCVVSATLWQCT